MSGERRGIDRVGAGLAFAATTCVSVVLTSLLDPFEALEVVGVAVPYAAYFGGLAWWRFRSPPAASAAEPAARSLAELEQRVAELEAGQAHLQELEERLDFAERLLTRAAERDRIGRGG